MDLSASIIFWDDEIPLVSKPTSVISFPNENSMTVMDDSYGVSHWSTSAKQPVSLLASTNSNVSKKAIIICRCFYKKRSACAVILEDGVVTITNVHDGGILDTSKSLLPHPQSAVSLPSDFQGSYLVVGDTNCNVVIIDIEKLLIINRLETPPPGFVASITCLCVGDSSAWVPAVLANRKLISWNITEQLESESKLLITSGRSIELPQCGSPVALAATDNEILLVVAIDVWFIYKGCTLISSENHNPETSLLLKGEFLPSKDDNTRVLIGLSNGTLKEYLISGPEVTLLSTVEVSSEPVKTLAWDMFRYRDQLVVSTGTSEAVLHRKVFPDVENGIKELFIKPKNNSLSCSDNMKPCCSHMQRSKDLSTIMLKGYPDGSISITSIGSTTVKLKAHSNPVCCIGVIKNKFLITSDDFGEVSIWAWDTWKLISTHCVHFKQVVRIIEAPQLLSSRHGILFFTIGSDGNIGFYSPTDVVLSLCGNGESTPTSAYFVSSTDMFVVFLGNKRSLHVWQLSSETLIKVITDPSQINAYLGSLRDRKDFLTIQPNKQEAGSATAVGLGKLSSAHVLPIMSVSLLEITKQLHNRREQSTARLPGEGDELPAGMKLVLAYLLQAEENDVFAKLRDVLNIESRPQPAAAISFSETSKCGDLISLPLDTSKPYKLSPIASAQRLVFGISFQYALCIEASEGLKQASKAVIYQYASVIPPFLRSTEGHFEADFLWCLDAIRVPHKDIQFAARCVLLGYLKNREVNKVIDLANQLIKIVKYSGSSEEEIQVALLGVSITAVQCPEVLKNTEIADSACQGLLTVTTSQTASTSLRTTALTMLANSYSMLSGLISNQLGLIRALTLMATSQPPYQSTESDINKVAFRALLAVGEHHLQLFFSYADHILAEAQVPKEDDALALQNCVISAIAQMIKKNPSLFVPCLLKVALLFLKALDPHFPRIREKCMAASAHALKTAVCALPMMAFHQAKQSLAVGDVTGQAIVWDMKTGSKWLVWDAHTAAITCISFSTMGNQIGTFSLREGSLKIWSADMSLLSILSSSNRPRLIATRNTNTENVVVQTNEANFGSSITWVSPHMVELTTHEGNSLQFEFR